MKSLYSRSGALGAGVMLAVWLAGLSGCAAQADRERTTLQTLAEDGVEPAYQYWLQQSRQMVTRVQQACATPDSPDRAVLADLQSAWRNEALAWSRLQTMQPGPATPVSVRVSYWPDKKDLVGRQVTAWLDQPVPTATALAGQSVTLQGLSALEFLLFDPRIDWTLAATPARLCPRVQVIAERQQALAEEALQTWRNEQGAGLREALPNARYATEKEALAELLKANVSGLEIAHKKIASALGVASGGKYPQPYLAEYWRSGLSLASARAVLEGSRALWQAGLSAAVGKKEHLLAASVDAVYATLLDDPLLATNSPALTALLTTPEQRAQLADFAGKMKALHMLYTQDVSRVLEVPLGINANDGD